MIDPVLIARLLGGMGNQMFIYATALAFARRWQRRLLLDCTSGFERDQYEREYALSQFSISSALMAGGYPQSGTTGRALRLLSRKFNRILPVASRYHICEIDSTADDLTKVMPKAKLIYLEGYWQAHEAFAAVADEVRREFQLREMPGGSIGETARQMSERSSVAVHIRRHPGRSSSGKTVADHPILPLGYYRRALEVLRGRVDRPYFYFFNDGVECSTAGADLLIPGADCHLISGNLPHEDLWLMSNCRHHIVANSSFSWWGAWLGRDVGGLTIAPSEGRYGQVMTHPHEWIQIEEN